MEENPKLAVIRAQKSSRNGFLTRGPQLEPSLLRGRPIAHSLCYKDSETCLSSQLAAMANDAGYGRREQPSSPATQLWCEISYP